jgi:N6-L-threonylcarbamoyladenine synthase
MTKQAKCFVGIDTSNYTTSVALCDFEGRIIANLKAPLTVKSGERGLRQSDAVFAHIKNLPALTDKLSDLLREYEAVAIGVSATPRAVEGSYMPCFLSGVAAAHSFAAARQIPIYKTAHQNGHVMAAMYSSGEAERLLKNRFLAFHVSGGTTEVLLVTPREDGEIFDIELVGETEDINAGQAIDRIGVMLGLDFPAGRELEALASSYQGSLEKKKISVKNCRCNLSGVENIAKKLYEAGEKKEKIAAFTFDFIQRTLCEMASQAIEKYGEMPILFAGGVMSNRLMRGAISRRFEAYFAEPEFSADNAAGVALLCRLAYIKDND